MRIAKSMQGQRWLLAICLTVLLLTSTPVVAQTQQWMSAANSQFRYELFQMLLEENGLKPTEPGAVLRTPERSVVVQIGRPTTFLTADVVEAFCARGGIVVLATDARYSLGSICHFHSALVQTPEVADRYQAHRDCLKINNIDNSFLLMDQVNQLIVNRTGWLSFPRGGSDNRNIVAKLPGNCTPARSSRQPIMAEINNWGDNGGRLFVAADPSLFTNGMFWHGDNARLALNLSRILAENDRDQMLFVIGDHLLGSYEDSPAMNTPPPKPPSLPNELPPNLPKPTPETMLRIANAVISEVEQSNLANEFLANRPRNLSVPFYKRILLFAAAIVAVLLIVLKFTSSSPIVQPAMPTRPMVSTFALNAHRRIKSAELGLSASILARELCQELTDSADPEVWQRTLSAISGATANRLQDSSMQKLITPLLELATNSRKVHISRKKFEAIGRSIQQLRTLHQNHRLFHAPTFSSATQ